MMNDKDLILGINTKGHAKMDDDMYDLYVNVYGEKKANDLNKRIANSGKEYLRDFLVTFYNTTLEHILTYEKAYNNLPGYVDSDEKKLVLSQLKLIERYLKIKKCKK